MNSEDSFDLMVENIKKMNKTHTDTATIFHDWDNIKNSTDKYNTTAMTIRKFKYRIVIY